MQPSEIKSFRHQNGFTQDELAEAIGTKRAAISVIELGKRGVSKSMSDRMENFFSFFRRCAQNGRL